MKTLVLYYLRFFARLAISYHRPKIIGITGSVGKTSTRNALYAVMKDAFKVKMIKVGNSETGIPLGILGIDPGHYRFTDWLRALMLSPFKLNYIKGYEYLIVEMGIDGPNPPNNMDYLLTIVKPDIAIVLNAYPVHTMQFDELFKQELSEEKRLEYVVKRIAKEKVKLINKGNPQLAVYNEDLKNIISPQIKKTVLFGSSNETNIKFVDYQVSLEKTSFKYLLYGENRFLTVEIKNFVLPKGYFDVFAAVIAVGKYLEIPDEQILKGLTENFSIPAGRGSIFEGINSSIIIDSSYNASRASVFTFLEMSQELSEKENRELVLLLGDMRELGEESKIEHELVAKKIIDLKVNKVYLVGPNTKKYILPKINEKVKEVKVFENSILAGEFLRKSLPYRAIVLVKGSQNEIFLEEAIKKILKNKTDEKMLCRQNDFWMKKKQGYFKNADLHAFKG